MRNTAPFPCRPGRAFVLAAAVVMSAPPMVARAQASTPMDPAPVLRCRSIDESAARLACYDAIALPGAGSRAGWGAPVGAGAKAAAAPARTAPVSPADSFGLEQRSTQIAPEQLESRIVGSVDGWEPNTRFTFENGQVWQVVDGSRAYYRALPQPKVTVSRGMLGTFYLQIDGITQTPRVRRVQ